MFGAIRRDMKVIGRTIKCMEMEEFNGLMVELMKVNSSMIENMAMEHFVGLMVVSMWVNGTTTKCTERVLSLFPTAEHMLAHIDMTRRMERAYTHGQMVVNMRENSTRASSTVLERS